MGKWKYQSEIRGKTDLQHPGTVQVDISPHTNLIMEISHFKKNGTITCYSEADIVNVWDYKETIDWMSGDGKTLYLTDGRNNQGVEIGYDGNLLKIFFRKMESVLFFFGNLQIHLSNICKTIKKQ